MNRWLDWLFEVAFWIVQGIVWLVDRLARLAGLAAVRTAARVLGLGVVHAALFLGVAYAFLFRVTAGQVGVRQWQIGRAGVEQRDRAPGLHPGLRWLSAWHLLDARTHVVAFGLEGDPASLPRLELRTRDGNLVSVAATVLYRIRPGEAWRLVADGLKHSYPALAAASAASLLRSELAELGSEDFASTDARQARMSDALPRLNERLAPLHLEAETIQLGDVSFWAEYEKALAEERLARESTRLAAALARLEQAKRGDPSAEELDTSEEIEAEMKRLRAQGERELERLRSAALLEIAGLSREAESYAALRRADADATHERELAAGQLELERAEAARERAQRAALEGEAGRIWLAREAAGRLRVRRAVLNAADPRVPALLDVDAVVRLLLGAGPQAR